MKIAFAGAFIALAGTSYGQLQDEKNVTVTMDLQPILQLEMSTPDQVDFVFDDIADYYRDVFVPMSYLIGGPEYIGHGWRMLVECLSVGRAISLRWAPSHSHFCWH